MDSANGNSTESLAGELVAMKECILRAEEAGLKDEPAPLLHNDFAVIRASGVKQEQKEFLDAVKSNFNLGRSAEPPEVRLYGEAPW